MTDFGVQAPTDEAVNAALKWHGLMEKEMTYDAFRRLVADMRHAQKDYFRSHSESSLKAAKSLEAKVDKALAELEQGQKKLPGLGDG